MTRTEQTKRRIMLANAVYGGQSPKRVAATYGVKLQLVLRSCKEHGVSTKQPKKATLTHEERLNRRKLMAKAVKSGATLQEVATTYGVTITSVKNACSENKVRVPPGSYVGVIKDVTISWPKIVAALLNTPDTYDQIGAKLGISKCRVGQVAEQAKKAGIKFRSNNGD